MFFKPEHVPTFAVNEKEKKAVPLPEMAPIHRNLSIRGRASLALYRNRDFDEPLRLSS